MADRKHLTLRPFSLRHAKALAGGRISVQLSEPLRRRLWSTLRDHNEPVYYSEPDNPTFIINSSVLEESEPTFGRLLGIDRYQRDGPRNCVAVLRDELGGHGQGSAVLDVPRPYAELAVHLAAAVNHFFIAQYVRRNPPALAPVPPKQEGPLPLLDDKIRSQ